MVGVNTEARPRHKQGIEGRKGMPRRFLDFQHPRLVDKPPTGPDWIHEVKFDGYRMQIHVEAGRATFYTRNGLDWTGRFPLLAAEAGELEDCVLDGELIAMKAEGYSNFSALRSGIFKDPDSLVLMVWDVLWHGAEDMRPFALTTRKKVLRKLLDEAGDHVAGGLRYVEPVAGEGRPLLDAACGIKIEGIVSKRLSEPYRGGAIRSDSWVKAKCRPSESIIVGGYVTDNERFSYLLGGVREADGRLRYAGAIKGGYAAETVRDLLPRINPLAADVSPFQIGSPRKTGDIHWLRPELVAEVEMAEFTGSGKMRQASFKGLRDDLAAADSS